MKKLISIAVACLMTMGVAAQTEEMIQKNHIRLQSDRLTPEALWAMGRIGSYAASPDGKHIIYNVAYYSVKQNKGHHVLFVMDVNA